MSIPRPDEETKELFESIVRIDPRIHIRPMFGSLAGFINGNMFTGIFGQEIFVRLPETKRIQLLQEGATLFSPMEGRPMKEYIAIPKQWKQNSNKISELISQSLLWAESLPVKSPAKKQSRKSTII